MLQRSPYRMTNMNLAHRGFGLNDGGKNGECQNHRQFIVHTFNGGQKLIQVAVNLPYWLYYKDHISRIPSSARLISHFWRDFPQIDSFFDEK